MSDNFIRDLVLANNPFANKVPNLKRGCRTLNDGAPMPDDRHARKGFKALLAVIVLACMSSAGHSADTLFPSELVRIVSSNPRPVFRAAPGQWDAQLRERGWIMREDDKWHLWYTGYENPDVTSMRRLGYATSNDGISWRRHPGNPLNSQ
jgi:hypothetical protein